MVRHLLKSGANAQATDRVGATALHYAAQTANGNLVRLLTRHGINVNSPDNEGWTPLHVAVQSGRTDIIKLLLRRGADINILNQDGNSPLDIALSFGKGFGFYHVVTSLKKASQVHNVHIVPQVYYELT
jgi:ankyrin repeat protein